MSTSRSESVIRAFIAISLTPEVYQRLDEVSRQLQGRIPAGAVRWVAVKNIHLTIKFLGDVQATNLQKIQQVLQAEVSHHPAFELAVSGAGAFPSQRKVRVVWVGVEAPPALNALQHGVEMQMASLGYAPEERAFSPHLTLGRVARMVTAGDLQRIGDVLEGIQVGLLGKVVVQTVHLYRSDLQPSGSVYTRLFTAPLA